MTSCLSFGTLVIKIKASLPVCEMMAPLVVGQYCPDNGGSLMCTYL